MRKLMFLGLVVVMLAACGISQSEFDAAIEETSTLSAAVAERDVRIQDLEHENTRILELETELEASIYEVYSLTMRSTELADEVVALNLVISDLQDKVDGLGPHLELSAAEAEIILATLDRQEIIDGLDAEIGARQAELDTLEVRIRETGEEPIRLGAGFYTSPNDIPPGRYRATGSSNFFVRDRNGRGRVNVILGGRNGLDYFVFNLSSGDEIEARSAFVLTPVE
ncbi:MAG: hypothetical protein FWG65_10895 [Turicibacter sp.]|nr:hypothetical protein [Turicibacter sp.]